MSFLFLSKVLHHTFHWNFASECHSMAQFCDAVTCLIVTDSTVSQSRTRLICTLTYTIAYMNIHTQVHTNHNKRSQAHTYTCTQTRAYTRSHTNTVQTFTQKDTNKSKKRQTQNTWTHAHTHERTHANTHPRSEHGTRKTNIIMIITIFYSRAIPDERAQLAYLIQVPIPFPFTDIIYPQ